MNSQRWCRGPLWTCVVGRRGSHHWHAVGRWARASMSVGLGVDHQPALLEAEVAAARSRPPRARTSSRRRRPTTQRARTVCVSSVGSSRPGSSSSWRRTVSVAPSASSTSPSATQPRWTATPSSAQAAVERRARAPAGRTGSRAPTPTSPGCCGVSVSSGSPSAPNQWYSRSGIISPARRSARPSACSSRMISWSMWTARGSR